MPNASGRAGSGWDAELRNASAVRDWMDRIDGTNLNQRCLQDPEIAENLHGLADLMRPIADEQQLRAHLESVVFDDVRVHRLREKWDTHQHVQGNDDYRYPAHLLGPGAAASPPPRSGFQSGSRGEHES